MFQGDNPLEVTTESDVEEDVEMPYNELVSFCQQFLEKYELLKKDNKKMKNKFDCMLIAKMEEQSKSLRIYRVACG